MHRKPSFLSSSHLMKSDHTCGSDSGSKRGMLLLQVLEAEPGNVKALYRRAQGHLAEQDFVEAELDIRAALLVRTYHDMVHLEYATIGV